MPRVNIKVVEPSQVRTIKSKIEGKADPQVMDFTGLQMPEGIQHKYSIFNLPPLFPFIKPGAVIDAEVNETDSKNLDPDGHPYKNRNVVNIFQGDKPVIEKQFQKGGNYQREDPVLRRRSYALSYAKDLVVAGKIEIKDILTKAEALDKWLMGTVTTSQPAKPVSQGKATREEPPFPEE